MVFQCGTEGVYMSNGQGPLDHLPDTNQSNLHIYRLYIKWSHAHTIFFK